MASSRAAYPCWLSVMRVVDVCRQHLNLHVSLTQCCRPQLNVGGGGRPTEDTAVGFFPSLSPPTLTPHHTFLHLLPSLHTTPSCTSSYPHPTPHLPVPPPTLTPHHTLLHLLLPSPHTTPCCTSSYPHPTPHLAAPPPTLTPSCTGVHVKQTIRRPRLPVMVGVVWDVQLSCHGHECMFFSGRTAAPTAAAAG